ncbi:two pore calcium channel protein 1 [Esox lucius]|uniref:Ion transport domain-containing protein n=1 Tax=Esox lucius TaxID=8010 RepID=A0A3P8YQ49_ESOLU|nr:two pore calcium channel protein 1 [Esox lucius]
MDNLDLAAVYVSDAQYNRKIVFDTSPQAIRLYLLYNHWGMQFLVYAFIVIDLALAIFEDPAVIPLPIWATTMIEIVCLSAFGFRLVHYAKVIPLERFWKDPKNICIIVIILLSLVDIIIYWLLKAIGLFAVRWSRVLRPLLLVNITEGRQLRRALRSIRNALPQILCVFLLFMFSVFMFSLLALKLFVKRGLTTTDGDAYFTSYLEIVFDLYVLVTTANSPDVMMPAYNSSVFFALFFFIYILINTYIFNSVFLAIVYNNYKKYLKQEVRQLVKVKRHKMVQAFELLQEKKGEETVVTQASWNQLVRLVQPDISNAHRELLWSVSDNSKKGCIGKGAFVQLPDLLNMQVTIEKAEQPPLQTLLPPLYLSIPSRLVCRMVRHRLFVYTYDLITLVNAVFICLDEENLLIANTEWVFLALYLLEILLKLYTFKPRTFFSRHKFWNWFDTIIVISPLIAMIINSVVKSEGYTSRQILDIVFILRIVRLIRVVDRIKRVGVIINTLIKMGPTMLTFGQLIVVVYYVFAMVGMELFKGKIHFFDVKSTHPDKAFCGNPLLKNSSFAKHNYCKNNFNNVISSFILLLELTVVNQWHVLASGFTAVTHVSARIFFVLFHIVIVIIIINIFIAFVLEAFFVEYTMEKSDLQSSLEKKIKELELGIKHDVRDDDMSSYEPTKEKPEFLFKIKSKRYKTLDGLMQKMFEADIGPEIFAEDEDGDADKS